MSTDLNSHFNEQYMNINAKLKKRFMRKPNTTEATNEFNALAIQCENAEQPTFAAHAYIGAAKCEGSVGNFLGEAEYYLAAARQFMRAEMKSKSLMCSSPSRVDLEASIGCYMQTITKYPEKSPLSTAVLMELANNLVILDLKRQALSYYEQAAQSISNTDHLKLNCLLKMISLNIDCDRFELALNISEEILKLKVNVPELILTELQMTRVLLALFVESDDNRRSDTVKELFQDLMNDDDDKTPFSEDLKLRLVSIIICCNTKDIATLIEVSADPSKLFNLEHQHILNAIIKKMESEQ